MSAPLADQLAFPGIVGVTGYGSSTPVVLPSGVTAWVDHASGLTVRQHFAAMAMQGLLMSNSVSVPRGFGRSTEAAVRAKLAVQEADALIAALEEKK